MPPARYPTRPAQRSSACHRQANVLPKPLPLTGGRPEAAAVAVAATPPPADDSVPPWSADSSARQPVSSARPLPTNSPAQLHCQHTTCVPRRPAVASRTRHSQDLDQPLVLQHHHFQWLAPARRRAWCGDPSRLAPSPCPTCQEVRSPWIPPPTNHHQGSEARTSRRGVGTSFVNAMQQSPLPTPLPAHTPMAEDRGKHPPRRACCRRLLGMPEAARASSACAREWSTKTRCEALHADLTSRVSTNLSWPLGSGGATPPTACCPRGSR
mmetsp:Transcript_30741/g.102384  ORF Transcript_30741/g.102384 Transcript_30741/m.102384 type:complete len:268 (+) Transcript_30741:1578-2381(+)